MISRTSLPAAALLIAGLAIAPGAQAREWHRGHPFVGHPHPAHRGGGAAAAIIGGMIGLGVGAAIASGGGYGPPPGYYAAPPPPAYGGY